MKKCEKCGFPEDLCVCSDTDSKIAVSLDTTKVKYGRIATVIYFNYDSEVNLRELAKRLKSKLGCGGSVIGNILYLQGNQIERLKETLGRKGFSNFKIVESIEL